MNVLNIIHLPERKDRMPVLMAELSRQGIKDFRIWPGFRGMSTANQNIRAAHQSIVKDAMKRNQKYVIIAEDDIMFPAPDGWNHFLKNMPTIFDIYLGGVYRGSENIYSRGFSGMHLYAISKDFYPQFLKLGVDQFMFDSIDNNISRLIIKGTCNAKLCYPMAAIQHEGKSDNPNQAFISNKYFFNKNNTHGYED